MSAPRARLDDATAARLRARHRTIGFAVGPQRRELNEQLNADIVALVDGGVTQSAIADALGTRPQAVGNRVRRAREAARCAS